MTFFALMDYLGINTIGKHKGIFFSSFLKSVFFVCSVILCALLVCTKHGKILHAEFKYASNMTIKSNILTTFRKKQIENPLIFAFFINFLLTLP